MRTVQINCSRHPDVHPHEYYKAIGYLSDWGNERFPLVKIFHDHKADITAVYCRSLDPDSNIMDYVIGAVWRGNEYTFHS